MAPNAEGERSGTCTRIDVRQNESSVSVQAAAASQLALLGLPAWDEWKTCASHPCKYSPRTDVQRGS